MTTTYTDTIEINGVTLFVGDDYKLDGEELELKMATSRDKRVLPVYYLLGGDSPCFPAYFIDTEDGSIREGSTDGDDVFDSMLEADIEAGSHNWVTITLYAAPHGETVANVTSLVHVSR